MREFGNKKRYDRRDSRRSDRDSDRFSRRSDSDRFSRSNSGGFNRRSGRRDEKRMHKVTCDSCGEQCEVPFKPTDSKPVYCNNCFKGRGKGKADHKCSCKDELEKINQKIDLILGHIDSMKKLHTPSKVEKVAEKKEKKPKAKKTAVKKKTTKKKVAKKKK